VPNEPTSLIHRTIAQPQATRASENGGGGVATTASPKPAEPQRTSSGAIPKSLAGATDRMAKAMDKSSGWTRWFMRVMDRISGAPAYEYEAAAPIAPQATPPQATPPRAAPPGNGRPNGAPPGFSSIANNGDGGPPRNGDTPVRRPRRPPPTEWEEAELIQDIKEASKRQTSRLARLLLDAMIVMFVAFVAWAALFDIEEVTRGDGKVVASSQTQVVANLEGGIVNAVLVREGDRVEKGQALLRLDNAPAQAQYRDNRAKYLSLTAQVARLTAELGGAMADFPAELAREAPEVVRQETALMTARRQQLEAQMQILRDQRKQRQQELLDLRGKAVKLGQQLRLTQEQLAILEPLAAEGLAPRVDVIRAQRELTGTETDLDSARTQIPRAEAALNETERKLDERLATFKADAQKELNERRTMLEGASELQASDRDRIRRTELLAPMRGTVKQIHVKTVGGVVKPGQDLIELVPVEDTLLVEIRIRPSDVGFVHPGQHASVKVTAFDYALYGQLAALVEDISADSLTDERDRTQEPFFRVRLRTEKTTLGPATRPLPIHPGMTVSADIQTGERTVLTYLMKPIFKTLTSAMGER
jgi:adhesin transport system membrane fusion protein